MNEQMKELLERVGKQFLELSNTDLDGNPAKMELVDYQLYLVAGDVRTPVNIIHMFEHVYSFSIDISKLSVNTDSIFKSLFELFKVDREELLDIDHRRIRDSVFTFDLENMDGRSNRKFTKEIRKYMYQRSHKRSVDLLRVMIKKAISTEQCPDGFLFKMRDFTEITLTVPENFETVEAILEHTDNPQADLDGFKIDFQRFNKFGSSMKYKMCQRLEPEAW